MRRRRRTRSRCHAFTATANKLVLADSYVAALAVALDERHAALAPGGGAGPGAFPPDRRRAASACCCGSSTCKLPAMRYAIRLALAMSAGPGADLALPALRPCQLGAADHRPDHARQLQRHQPAALGPRHRHPDRLRPGRALHQHPAARRAAAADRAGGGHQPCLWRWPISRHRHRRVGLVAAAAAFRRRRWCIRNSSSASSIP